MTTRYPIIINAVIRKIPTNSRADGLKMECEGLDELSMQFNFHFNSV